MHIFFSGIGGTGIGPLALIASQAGYEVSGSDKQDSSYVGYLREHGISNIHIGQTKEAIAQAHASHPIDWFVYSSALPKENPEHPELMFAEAHHIRHSKRDEFLQSLLKEKNQAMIAIAGTHGKTTTTAMMIWLLKEAGIPLSYSVGAKLSFGEMGQFDKHAKYFVYECDEYDRNFLAFHPHLSVVAGIDYDHADIYPTRDDYYNAFRSFMMQSFHKVTWEDDMKRLGDKDPAFVLDQNHQLAETDPRLKDFTLPGEVNRRDALLVAEAAGWEFAIPFADAVRILNAFPGVTRRFEQLVPGLYSDYAHTPGKIKGALQLAHEVAGSKVVVVYEGLHNTRQYFIKADLRHLFDGVKKLYVVPSYLAREDPNLELLKPADIIALTSKPEHAEPAMLDGELKAKIQSHLTSKELVLCLSAGGGGSLDEWLRQAFSG